MKTRVTFGVVGGIFVLLALYVLPSIVALTAMLLLSVVAAQEFAAATVGKQQKGLYIAAVILSLFMATASSRGDLPAYWKQAVLLVGVVALFGVLLGKHDEVTFSQVGMALFAGIVIPYLMMSLIRILTMTNGKYYILIPLLAAWGSDTCALFAGMAFGKHKLAPVVSPKKTIEGAIGGVLGATLLLVLYGVIIRFGFQFDLSILMCAVIGVCGAVLGQVGDLSFSIVKRQSGIKDYGKIFPGHGGVLDRFDSVLFVAPAVEVLVALFAQLKIG